MGIVRARVFGSLVILFTAACGFPRPADVGPDDAQPNGPGYRLLAVTPAMATSGDTIFLEGTFADSATVQFPGGAMQAATVLGVHRAAVLVPDAATAGDLTVLTGGVTTGPVGFRRTSFALGLQPFRIAYEQTDGARQSPALRIARSAATTAVIKNWLYVIGGDDGGHPLNSIERAAVNADGTVDGFELVGDIALGQARSGHTSAVVGNALYVIGGSGSTGALNSVERAAINADGSLGNFTVAPNISLVTARSGHTSTIVGDAVYVVGGARSDGGKLASIERAEIQPDGSLAAFTAVDATLTQARGGHSTELVGDALYVIGGDAGSTATGSVERASIHGDGSLASFTTAGSGLISPRSGHATAVIGSALYVIGGPTAGGIGRDIERAPIGANGSLGPFAAVSASALSAARSDHAIAVVRDTLYVIGGRSPAGPLASAEHSSLNANSALAPFMTSEVALVLPRTHDNATTIRDAIYVTGRSGDTNSIERASLLADGSLTAFTTLAGNALVLNRSSHCLGRISHYLYAIGGSAPAATSSVERAIINGDGSLGQFTEVSASLKLARSGAVCVALGSFLYAIGGIGVDHGRLISIERAVINGDGTLGSFDIVPGVTLTTGRNYFTILVTDRFLYVVGGLDDAIGGTASIERAAIGSDGSLSTFAPALSLQFGRGTHSSVVVGNAVYVVGGLIAGEHVPDLERAIVNLDGTLSPFGLPSGLSLTETRARHMSVVIGNHAYLIGGETMSAGGEVSAVLGIEHASVR